MMKTAAGCLLVVLALWMAGCATTTNPGDVAADTVKQHPGTAVGAGAGAAGGAVIGGVAGGTKGAVVGGLLGGLAGGLIGNYIDRRDDSGAPASGSSSSTTTSGQSTASTQSDKVTGVRMDRVQSVPTSVAPGGTVNLGATYTVFGSADQPVDVKETREVRHLGELVANPTAEVSRTRGTYTTSLPITLPASAPSGSYDVTTTVVMGDRQASQTSTFQVQ
jgi:hypothetical protein